MSSNIKKLNLYCIILVSLLLVGCASGNKQYAEISSTTKEGILQLPIKYQFFDASIDDQGKLLIADKDSIIIYDQAVSKIDRIEGLSNCTSVSSGEDNIYAIDTIEDEICLISYDMSGENRKQIPLELEGSVQKMAYANNSILFLCQTDRGAELVLYNELTEKTEILVDNCIAFTMISNYRFFYIQDNGYTQTCSLFDLNKQKSISEERFIGDEMIDIAYHESSNTILGLSYNGLYVINSENGATISTNYNTAIQNDELLVYPNNNELLITENNIYIVYKDRSIIETCFLEKVLNNNNERLTIFSGIFQTMLNNTAVHYKKTHENIDIVFNSIATDEEFLLNIMSGNDADIIAINSCVINPITLLKAGAIHNLLDFDVIVDALNHEDMIKGITKGFMHDEFLMGVPLSISIDTYEINKTLYEAMDITLPEDGYTWDDLFDLAVDARQDIDGDGEMDTYLMEGWKRFPPFIRQYYSNYVDDYEDEADFNNDVFIHLLKRWKELWDKDLVLEKEGVRPNESVLLTKSKIHAQSNDKPMIPLPSFDTTKTARYPSPTIFMSISSMSDKPELAAEFIALYLSPEVQLMDYNYNVLLYNNTKLYKGSQSGITPLSDENMDLMKNLIPNMNIAYNIKPTDLAVFIGDTIEEYMQSDDITAKEVATKIQNKADMIFGE